ncbi:ABC transporter permease [Mycolicibacterium brumae]|uniref:ABC transporter permease n=1 Tax=Mycolicibacterium brumae TaxID=85968 RepID=A0A2G5PCA4_9MYCO|nr:ABC transporter permease [Mycolicibacterium brumae]MCV7193111.1 ABC transporter permease [Mycolicibacterium brumae]PIB75962.1 ABC transporter permease [Mycolicibacterium brumae]RWA16548.1 ABC transporter permease [Mycolicibacterium brumae DSM 44177]UWW09767.1 ABC transporter permease [Mycolicibacterium brumae]
MIEDLPSSAKPSKYFDQFRFIERPAEAVGKQLHTIGGALLFVGQVLYYVPVTIKHYRREILARMVSLSFGRGSLVVDGGVISVLLILGVAIGASIAIEAWATLNLLGFGALSGIVGGLANVREMAPLVAGIAFASQAGCRMTAEIGAMRIAEEIDATEAMGLRALPYVVGTRFIGGLLIVIPGFALTLLVSFFVTNAMITEFYGAAQGTYQHYFVQFLSPTDLLYSTLKATVFCAAVTIIHCYYGYFASGGPVGVGVASGRAVRASLVAIMVLNFGLTVTLWGLQPTFVFTG